MTDAFFFKILLLSLWLHWVLAAVHELPLVAVQQRLLVVVERRLLTVHVSVVVAQGLSRPLACRSFQTRNRTPVPCIGRWILNH